MIRYRNFNMSMGTKTKMGTKSPSESRAEITPAMLKKEASDQHLESLAKEKFQHSIDALKDRIKARRNLVVKHSESHTDCTEPVNENIPEAPPPYPHPPPYENPKLEKPIVPRFDAEEIKKTLKKLQKGRNLEKLLETHGIRQGVDVPSLKKHMDVVLKDVKTKEKKDKPIAKDLKPEVEPIAKGGRLSPKVKPITKDLNPADKWQRQMSQLKDLNHGDNLEKWLESLDVPNNVSAPHVKAKLRKYFMHETFETLQGRSIIYEEDTRAKKLWDQFKDMNPAKQVAVVVGITAVTAVVGFFTWELLMLVFPSVMAVNPFLVEVGAQVFVQRQEGAYHLLMNQTERMKPLSTAWANQFILWKYI